MTLAKTRVMLINLLWLGCQVGHAPNYERVFNNESIPNTLSLDNASNSVAKQSHQFSHKYYTLYVACLVGASFSMDVRAER